MCSVSATRRVGVVFALSGWLTAGLCVSLLIRVGLGVAPYDVFNTGFARTSGISPGLASVITGMVTIVVARLFGLKMRWGSLVGLFLVGVFIDFGLVLWPHMTSLAAPVRLGVAAVALCGLWLAISLIVVGAQGASGPDLLMVALCAKGLAVAPVRLGIEVVFVTGGWLLGGDFGVATLAFALASGPVLATSIPKVRKWFHSLLLA